MARTQELLKVASGRLKAQERTISELQQMQNDLQEKLAAYERKEIAEEIVNIKIASGACSHEDFQDEVAELVGSDADLGQIKTAMRYAGPGYVKHNLVEDNDETASKEASAAPQSEALRQAQTELDNMLRHLDDGDL